MNLLKRWMAQGEKYGQLNPIDPSRIDIGEEDNTSPTSWRCQVFRSITSDSATFHTEKSTILNSKKVARHFNPLLFNPELVS